MSRQDTRVARRAILNQDGGLVLDADIPDRDKLGYVLKQLFAYRTQTQTDREPAFQEFKPLIPDIAKAVVRLIGQVITVSLETMKTVKSLQEI